MAWMVKCQSCESQFDKSEGDTKSGGILLNICPTCKERPAAKPQYVQHGSLLIPNS